MYLETLFNTMAFVVFPILFYIILEHKKLKEILGLLQLTTKNIKQAIFYGAFVVFFIFLMLLILATIILMTDTPTPTNLSNTQTIIQKQPFIPLLVFLIMTSISEEIFFRGFLVERLRKHKPILIILAVSSLFALAHITFGKPYTILMTFIMGVLLTYGVIKTKNLYSAIIGHTIVNIITLIISY